MGETEVLLAATAGAIALALAAALWSVSARLRASRQLTLRRGLVRRQELEAAASVSALEAIGACVLAWDGGDWRLAAGEEALARCAVTLGCPPEANRFVQALAEASEPNAAAIAALVESGRPASFSVATRNGGLEIAGATAGAAPWLRIVPASQVGLGDGRLLDFADALDDLVWVEGPGGDLIWANRAWLTAVDAPSIEAAREQTLHLDEATSAQAREAVQEGQTREAVRWITVGGARRAYKVTAAPLSGGAVGLRAADVTQVEETREAVRRHAQAHDETLNHIADAVAVFSSAKRLTFHNTAFASLWGLETAWLAEGPSHGELLDRLRQRRRLPETADYAAWKARELSHYEALEQGPDELWTLPDGRTLRVVRQTHPMGGLLLLFADITGELRLKAQYNALIQVHQATLDKLNDAVAVFASDGRLRLHNEAFERFWNISRAQLEDAGDFAGVVELCTPRLHDRGFWRELQGRVTDPDPQSRVATNGEARTSDDRIVTWQSRPLPDGATLLAFDDVTDTRRLERAFQDRSAALDEAERLKRDFVGNVSYELRTPLTTIIGYSELLDFTGDTLPAQARGHVGAVRAAASQLARSIDDVLDMAQIDAGEMALDIGDVEVCALLRNCAERAAREAEKAGVEIEIDCAAEVGLIRADEDRLAQALDHLMENALRHSPRGARVRVSAARSGSEVTLKVTDQGRGIPFHVQARIFDRFVGREQGGPGLALALVKAIVELHGGWVALESEPGAGSTFTLHLPEEAAAGGVGQSEMF